MLSRAGFPESDSSDSAALDELEEQAQEVYESMRPLDPGGGVAAPVLAELSSLVEVRRSFASVRRTRRSKGCCLKSLLEIMQFSRSKLKALRKVAADKPATCQLWREKSSWNNASLMRKVVDELQLL